MGNLPLVAIAAALINNQNGHQKVKLIEVTPTSNDYYDHHGMSHSAEEILRSLIELDGSGDPAIRVGFHTTTGSTNLTASELSIEQHFRSIIGKTSDGKPYLRVTLDEL